MAQRLTNKIIDSIPTPETGTVTEWDSEVKGFGVRAYPATKRNPDGARTFFLNYSIEGREHRHTIGGRPLWSVEAARIEARELRKRVDRGDNPAAQKRERREAPTIADLIARYETEVIPTKRLTEKARLNDEKRMLELISDSLGKHTKVTDVHSGDIEKMRDEITGARGPIRANRTLAVCSKAFSRSLVSMAGENKPWRDAAAGNPCKGVERNHEDPDGSGRLYTPKQIAAITEALASYQGPSADCVRLILLTGCRPSEAMRAHWQQLDREPGYWIKASAHTKQKKEHHVPLAAPALELVDRLRSERKDGATWLFPSPDDPAQPLVALWHVWHHVRDTAKLPDDARLYDLRHSFASTGAGNGLSLPIIGRLLGHTNPRTTQKYAKHLSDDPLKAAAEKITAAIQNASKPSTNVVPLRENQTG